MKFGMPPLGKMKREDWQFVLSVFLPVTVGLTLVTCQPARVAESVSAPAVVDTKPKPIPITLQWPRGFFRQDLSYRPTVKEDTPLGHTRWEATKVAPYIGFELWMVISDGKVKKEKDWPYCNYDVPIIEADWSAPPQEDGCGGCEGPPSNLIGYRSYCGPRRYYDLQSCKRDMLGVSGEFLYGDQERGYYDDQERWRYYDQVRVECRPVKLDEYPVSDFEFRDAKALAAARKANGGPQ